MRMDERFNRDGFVVVPNLFSFSECESAAESMCSLQLRSAGSRRGLEHEGIGELAERLRLASELREIIPRDYIVVQCIFFDKSPDRNWMVPFHRDVHVPLKCIVASEVFSEFSIKEGIAFAKAHDAFMGKLIAIRLSLDDSTMENGPLRLIPGSHRGVEVAENESGLPVLVPKGGVLVMNPLVLHASSKMITNSRRRILHFLFGPCVLPDGAQWARIW